MQAILNADLDSAGLTPTERALMDYVKQVNDAAYKTTAEDVQRLREHGWSNDQVSEAVYITAMFAFFNRVADAFGIPSMDYLKLGKETP